MAAFLLRRFIYLVLLVIISTSVAYVLAATQLNPRSRYEGRNPPPPPEVVDAVLDAVNMNNRTPLVDRFGRWAGGVVRGDLGRTIDNTSVNEEIGRRMWVSLRLLLFGALSARRSASRPARSAPSSSIVPWITSSRCSRSSRCRPRWWCSPSSTRTPASR